MKKLIYFTSLIFCLTSCSMFPQLLTEAENVIDDDAIQIKVSREALGRQTNVKAHIELDNGQTTK